MPVTIVVGCQWGDEGKGKIVDLLSKEASVVARYQGGANAGHTVVRDGRTFVLHTIPTGALRPGVLCVLGHGVVLDPARFLEEVDALAGAGVDLEGEGRLAVSGSAHVILPYHKALEQARESGLRRVGSTLRGIGPAYADKMGRVGIRVADLQYPDFLLGAVRAVREETARQMGPGCMLDPVERVTDDLLAAGRRIARWVADVPRLLDDAVRAGRNVILEGAQGTMLDVDHGTYPFVTSSSSTAGGACTGLGLGPTRIDCVLGVAKAYTTRVGDGPFPTEERGDRDEALRAAGREYGATTGRPRRCGWLDLPVLRHAVRVNGIAALALTKLDVLDGVPVLPVAVAYETPLGRTEDVPADRTLFAQAKPVYREFEGWMRRTSGARELADLPDAARRYIAAIEEACAAEVALVSVGGDSEETIRGRSWPPARRNSPGVGR
jgi:adenylosuccinate synthase